MKKILFLLVALLTSQFTRAYDIAVKNSDGVKIYYNISGSEASVTYCYDYDSGCNSYSGIVIIPESVTHNSANYSVTSIGRYAFNKSDSLKEVTIPNSVTSIGEYAFSECTALTSVNIPNSVTSIGSSAFELCRGLTTVNIPNSVTSIGSGAFCWCDGLTKVTLPNSITSINKGVFYRCSSLTTVTIPNSVTSIGSCAFIYCDGLIALSIPNSVTSIHENAFYYCSGLKTLTIEDGDTELSLYSTNSSYYPFLNCSIENFYIGRYISSWEPLCISSSLKEVEIGNFVTSIPPRAFYGCSDLTSVTIGNSVTSIGLSAFRGCSGLVSITIPNSVTSIGQRAFEKCTGLTTMTLPEFLSSIGERAFDGCTGLTSVYLGNSLTSISKNAFRSCTSLTSLSIPNSITSIGDSAFGNCDALTDVVLEDGETSIDIAPSAFGEGVESLRIGRNLSSDSSFAGISTLKTAWITDIPTSIAPGTFQNCSNLDFGYVGDNVTAIGDRAFSGCSSLTLFQFGKNVTSIGADALADCTGITNIYAEPLTPPAVATQALGDLDRWSCTMHVPSAAMDAYKAADQWQEFFFYDSDFAIVLSDEAISLEPGQTFQLTAYTDSEHTSRADAATESEVRWVSTNTNVAVVDQNGFVVGTGSGKCSIAAFNSDNVMANCVINIDPDAERVITLDTYNLQINVNGTHQFESNVDAATLTWSSSNPEVARVDSNGFLTALSKGSALITAANSNGDSATCLVNVNESAGIDSVNENSLTIRVEGCEIVIEGLADDVPVHVLSADGKLVYSGSQRRISVPNATVYIVVYPGGSRKIAL